jgi:hypothetical protein
MAADGIMNAENAPAAFSAHDQKPAAMPWACA